VRDYIGGDLSDVRWRAIGGGVRQAMIKTADRTKVRLLSIPGGTAIPDHGHRGLELTLVLKGAFRDEDDRFGPGDIEVATEDLDHTPVAEEGETCICLAATDAPLRFRGLIPRIAQPFIGI
jgi:putative transcriptional regulator